MTAQLFGVPIHPIEGYSVMERPDLLRYDDLAFDSAARVVVVGELAQFLWRIDVDTWKNSMRKEAAQRLADFAAKVGVAYPLETS